jgi:BirA family transcriptional regulator, biotin operon repressor / biotin---[acetyl-CoA-carboxylase] ligase
MPLRHAQMSWHDACAETLKTPRESLIVKLPDRPMDAAPWRNAMRPVRVPVGWGADMTDPVTIDYQPLAWDAESLWRQLEPLLPGLAVEVVARSESTNTQLLQRLRGAQGAALQDMVLPGRRASDTQPCLLVAEHQTVGRGRMGRSWQAAPGASLTFSLALPLAPVDWSGLSLAVGVALAEALDHAPAGSPHIGLKWPNDLWLDQRKLGGVLIETVSIGSQRMAVIGIGLNVRPMEVAAVSSGYACLSELDPTASAPAVLHRLAGPLVLALRSFERQGFGAFHARFAARDVLRGHSVRSGLIEGVAQGVAPSGALQVATQAGMQLISSNEVSVRLAAWGPTTPSGLG